MKKKKISKKLDLRKKEISSLSEINGGVIPIQGAITVQPVTNAPKCVSRVDTCLCMTYDECNSIQANCPV